MVILQSNFQCPFRVYCRSICLRCAFFLASSEQHKCAMNVTGRKNVHRKMIVANLSLRQEHTEWTAWNLSFSFGKKEKHVRRPLSNSANQMHMYLQCNCKPVSPAHHWSCFALLGSPFCAECGFENRHSSTSRLTILTLSPSEKLSTFPFVKMSHFLQQEH